MPPRKTRPRADGPDVHVRHLRLSSSEVSPNRDRHSMIGCAKSQLHALVPMAGNFQVWQTMMLQTHKQIACPGCGAFVVYIPRLGR